MNGLSYYDLCGADKWSPAGYREKENTTFSLRYVYTAYGVSIHNQGVIQLIRCLQISRAKKLLFICSTR